MPTRTELLQSVGEYFHLYNRGVNRSRIFFDEENYEYFIRRVEKYLDPTCLYLLVYCLMPNHFHFIVRQDKPYAMAEFIHEVCEGYTKAINKRYHRSGHLFEGRYKMKHIDDNSYLVHLSSYIHLNPVRANLTARPENWKHSTCSIYFGLSSRESVSTEFILSQFPGFAGYRAFVDGYQSTDKEKIEKFLIK